MPVSFGEQAVLRALASVRLGGLLQLGFFGGEPLIEAARIREWIRTTRRAANLQGKKVRFNLTTNGTIANINAWAVMLAPDVDLAVSCDGTPARHDKHRVDSSGEGSFAQVETCLRGLVTAGRSFSVVMVVRPDTLDDLTEGLTYLRGLGVKRFTLSLDVWTTWTASDLGDLARTVESTADLWKSWLPDVSIDWFDTRIAALARLRSTGPDTRCSFGEGGIAVAPSGRLYPCERLVGEDRPGHPLQLAGSVEEGEDFLDMHAPCAGHDATCTARIGCRCSNYVRTGSTAQEDTLLQMLDHAVQHSITRLINTTVPPSDPLPQ